MQTYNVHFFANTEEYKEWLSNTKEEIISVNTIGNGIIVTVKISHKLNEGKE